MSETKFKKAQKIAQLRKSKNLTLKMVAEECNLGQSTIYQAERGATTVKTMDLIEQTLLNTQKRGTGTRAPKSFQVPITTKADIIELLTGHPITLESEPADSRGKPTYHQIKLRLAPRDLMFAVSEAARKLQNGEVRRENQGQRVMDTYSIDN
jgi:transcriptional regulator with XRE-family HTH domain